ncbi:hypothetical protein HS125_05485 [bacterium]|nr:hypothetical protein [bacterium]
MRRLAVNFALALAAALVLAAMVAQSDRRRAGCLCALLTTMVVAESAWLFYSNVELRDRGRFMAFYFPRTSMVDFLLAQENPARILAADSVYSYVVRKDLEPFFPNRMTFYHVYDARGYDRLVLRRYTQYFNRMLGRGPDEYLGMILKLADVSRLNSDMLARLNVGYLLSTDREEPPWSRPAFACRIKRWTVMAYPHTGNLGPAFLCEPACLTAPAEAETVLAAGTVEFSIVNPEEYFARVHAEGDCVLVFSQIDYPGWRAELDGRAVPVQTAFENFVAVQVPAVEHEVRLEFRSTTVRRGLAVSGLGSLILLTVTVIIWRRERRRKCS